MSSLRDSLVANFYDIMNRWIIFLLLASSLVVGCGHKGSSSISDDGDTLKCKYAHYLLMVRHSAYTEVVLSNPWKKGSVLHRYVLVAREDSGTVSGLPDGTVVYTPVRSMVVATAPHCQLMEYLGAQKAVKGVFDAMYIKNTSIRSGLQNGSVTDCGSSMQPNLELLAKVAPDAIFVSPYENSGYGALSKLGIPLLECADYMETSALGRAEWMKFYGLLVGREAAADSLFDVVESCYKNLSQKAKAEKRRPKVITERVYSGVWYCPGGHSSMAGLLADAGAHYVFADDDHSGSLSLSPEKVLETAKDADYWLFVHDGPSPLSPAQLLKEYAGYGLIKAFREGNIYECSGTSTDYFENLSFRPDLILEDMVHLFHPSVCTRPSVYYQRWKSE